MATLFVYTKTMDMPEEHRDLFWAFSPDDWVYFILGDDEGIVQAVADGLLICDAEFKTFPGGRYGAVTYHA